MRNKVYICNIHLMHLSIKILRLQVSHSVATVQMQKGLKREHCELVTCECGNLGVGVNVFTDNPINYI